MIISSFLLATISSLLMKKLAKINCVGGWGNLVVYSLPYSILRKRVFFALFSGAFEGVWHGRSCHFSFLEVKNTPSER